MRQLRTRMNPALHRRATLTARWYPAWLLVLLAALVAGRVAADDLAAQLEAQLSPYLLSVGDTPLHQITEADLAAFYAARAFRPVWSDPQRRERLTAAIRDLTADGFDPHHYPVSSPHHDGTPTLCEELSTTRSYLQALLHLQFGLKERATVEPLWHHREPDRLPQRTATLRRALDHLDDPAELYAQARPATDSYRALRAALADLLVRQHELPWPVVDSGPLLRPGATDGRVAQLRARLEAQGYAIGNADRVDLYDEALERAVRQFQHRHYLAEDGIVGPATLGALNTPRSARIDQMRVNLERLRWRSSELEPHMVVVDIAGARVRYYRDGALAWQSRTQVGTSARRTPILRSEVTHFTFNPSWTIPPTILRQDKLPRIRSDPDYLEESRLRVLDTDGNVLDPSEVDWSRPGAIMLRQDPGPDNPLGQVAIRFPNPFSVYLHDTPSQRLFASAQRTFSSGCVRVEDAMTLVDHLIEHASDYSEGYIARVVASGRTGNIRLTRPVPLLMDYWTAEVDDCGELILRPDIYRRDGILAEALRQPVPQRALPSCPAP